MALKKVETGAEMSAGYRAERETLLLKVEAVLREDERVEAAWLFGSLGRGTADDLSDIDLFVVVADEHLPAVIEQKAAFAASPDVPLLTLEAPQNAPPGGAYTAALYDGIYGPHAIDWYWQARSIAQIPTETRLLFDRAGLPRLDTPTRFDYQPVPRQTPEEAVSQAVNACWYGILIAGKYVARSPFEEHMGLLGWVNGSRGHIQNFLGLAAVTDADTPHPTPQEKSAVLRRLCAEMEALMPQVEAKGGRVCYEVAPSIYRYLDMIEAICTY